MKYAILLLLVTTLTGCVGGPGGIANRSSGNITGSWTAGRDVVVHIHGNSAAQEAEKTVDAGKIAANTAVQGSGVQQTKGNASQQPTDSDQATTGDQSADTPAVTE